MVRALDLAMPEGGSLSLLFAREPEQDLELEELESDQPPSAGSPQPDKPPTSRFLIWALVLIIVAGGSYFLLEPDTVLRWLGQEPAPSPTPVAPPVARPARPVEPPVPAPEATASEPTLTPVPTPQFAEGQQVSLSSTGPSPSNVPLAAEPTGTSPGPVIQSGSTVTVLDAELQSGRWVYHVRANDGRTGWIAETHLAATP